MKSLEDPSRRTAILDLVGAGRLVNALSLDVLNNTTGKLLRPLIGGVLVETVGFPGAYGCVLGVHMVNLGLMTRFRIPPAQGARPGEPIWHSLAVAVRHAMHSPMLLGLLYVTMRTQTDRGRGIDIRRLWLQRDVHNNHCPTVF